MIPAGRAGIRLRTNLQQDAFGCYKRDDAFGDRLKARYAAAGWQMAIFKYPDIDAHHIHPIKWGGDNSVIDNGVFLLQSVHHSQFDPWWRGITAIPD